VVPEVARKWSRKWSENEQKVVRKWSESGPESGPESVQKVCPQSFRGPTGGPGVDLLGGVSLFIPLAEPPLEVHPRTTCWPPQMIAGPLSENIRHHFLTTFGPLSVHFLTTFGTTFWPLPGPLSVHFRDHFLFIFGATFCTLSAHFLTTFGTTF
jgi:hypothetical protein